VRHYDPLYFRSMNQHYPQLADAPHLTLTSLAPDALDAAAAALPL
jgi:hypothetical protein